MKEGERMTFEELLLKLKVTENDYRLAVRSSLNAPTVFLERKPKELRINNHNPPCLKAWRANMDIQFVLDVHASAMYIVSYISKAQKGMSELLQGSRVGAVVRALAFHRCVPGSIPPGVICGLSLLVLYSAPRGFSPELRFSPLLKNQHLIWFDLLDLQSLQLVQHSCTARTIWDSNKIIIISHYYHYYFRQV